MNPFFSGNTSFFPRISHPMVHLPSRLVPCLRVVTAVRPNMTSRFRRILAVAWGQAPRPGIVEGVVCHTNPRSSVGRRGTHCYQLAMADSDWSSQQDLAIQRGPWPKHKTQLSGSSSQPNQSRRQPHQARHSLSQPSQLARATRAASRPSQSSSQVCIFCSCQEAQKDLPILQEGGGRK